MHWFRSLALHSEAPWKWWCSNCSLSAGGCFWRWGPDRSCCPGSAPAWGGSEVAPDGFTQAQVGCWPLPLAVPISPLTSFPCRQEQSEGWGCLMELRSRLCKQPVLLSPRMLLEKHFHIYPGLLSALQLLLTQINVSFLSLYFLQSWHVAMLQSVAAVLSLELRNTFSSWFPGNSRPPPHCICCHDCGSSVPRYLSCVGSLPSPCLPLPFPFLLPPLLHFFPFSSFSFLSEKRCCCMCLFQTSFQPY